MDVAAHWSHQQELTAEAASAGRARRFVRASLAAHRVRYAVDDIELVVSELATNAMQHAHTPFTVTLQGFDHMVHLEVQDGSPSRPLQGEARLFETTGRGVAIVDTLSSAWGVNPGIETGKSVWAEFDLESE